MSDPGASHQSKEVLPTLQKDELTQDFNCSYWQRRFALAREQVPRPAQEA